MLVIWYFQHAMFELTPASSSGIYTKPPTRAAVPITTYLQHQVEGEGGEMLRLLLFVEDSPPATDRSNNGTCYWLKQSGVAPLSGTRHETGRWGNGR